MILLANVRVGPAEVQVETSLPLTRLQESMYISLSSSLFFHVLQARVNELINVERLEMRRGSVVWERRVFERREFDFTCHLDS